MNYKIVYYDEFINDFGGVEKGYFKVIISQDKFKQYGNDLLIIEIEKTNEPVNIRPVKVMSC